MHFVKECERVYLYNYKWFYHFGVWSLFLYDLNRAKCYYYVLCFGNEIRFHFLYMHIFIIKRRSLLFLTRSRKMKNAEEAEKYCSTIKISILCFNLTPLLDVFRAVSFENTIRFNLHFCFVFQQFCNFSNKFYRISIRKTEKSTMKISNDRLVVFVSCWLILKGVGLVSFDVMLSSLKSPDITQKSFNFGWLAIS